MKMLKVLLGVVVFVVGVFLGHYAYTHITVSKAEANSYVPTVTFKELEKYK